MNSAIFPKMYRIDNQNKQVNYYSNTFIIYFIFILVILNYHLKILNIYDYYLNRAKHVRMVGVYQNIYHNNEYVMKKARLVHHLQ